MNIYYIKGLSLGRRIRGILCRIGKGVAYVCRGTLNFGFSISCNILKNSEEEENCTKIKVNFAG